MQYNDMDDVRPEPDPRTTPIRNRRAQRGNRTNARQRAITQSRRGW